MKPRVPHSEIKVALLTGGVAAVERMMGTGRVAHHSLRRAFEELQDIARDRATPVAQLADFEVFLRKHGVLRAGRLGRPDVGDVRNYSVLEADDETQFVRVPVDYLEQPRGSSIRVRFLEDGFRGEVIND